MALINCPECGASVSSSAVACPSCAFPLDAPAGTPLVREPTPLGVRRPEPMGAAAVALNTVKGIAGRLVLGGWFLISGIAFEAPPVIIGALIVVGSCIPLWLKAKKVARGEGSDTGAIEHRIRAYVTDSEDRHLRAVEDLEAEHARRLADLEERIDFTERMMIKRRESESA